METIYLVGQISEKYEETYAWRTYIENHFYGVEGIEVINPCANPFNKKIIKEKPYIQDKQYSYTGEFGIEVITSKDLMSIIRCSIAVVNMNQYDPNKELIGSYFEMAWLFDRPEKVVIGITKDINSYACRHPFVKQTVDTWCADEDEACHIIEKYF